MRCENPHLVPFESQRKLEITFEVSLKTYFEALFVFEAMALINKEVGSKKRNIF